MVQHEPGSLDEAQTRDYADATAEVTVVEVDSTTITGRAFWLGLADRVIKTFLQSLLTFLGVGVNLFNLNWSAALEASLYASLVSALIGLSLAVIPDTGSALVDAAGRVARTFVGAFAGALPATAVTFGAVDWRAAVALAATAALLSVLTSVSQYRVAGRVGPAV